MCLLHNYTSKQASRSILTVLMYTTSWALSAGHLRKAGLACAKNGALATAVMCIASKQESDDRAPTWKAVGLTAMRRPCICARSTPAARCSYAARHAHLEGVQDKLHFLIRLGHEVPGHQTMLSLHFAVHVGMPLSGCPQNVH